MSSKKSARRRIQIPLNRIAMGLVVLGVAIVGTYMLIQTYASNYSGDNMKNQMGGVYFIDEKKNASYQAGQSYFLTAYANVPSSAGHLDLEYGAASGGDIVQYVSHSCQTLGSCNTFTTSGYDFGTCVDVAGGNLGRSQVPVVTILFNKLKNDPSYVAAFAVYWHTGSCASSPNHGHSYYDQSSRLTVLPDQAPAQHGIGGGPQGTDLLGVTVGAGDGNTRATGTGTGMGTGQGGGGGSSAIKQSTQSKHQPITSAQGETRVETAPTPSPFYDGKHYAAGSDSDGHGLVASTTGQAIKKWPLALFVGVLLSGLAAFALRRHYQARWMKR